MNKKIKLTVFVLAVVLFSMAFSVLSVFGSAAQSSAYSLRIMSTNGGNITVTVDGAVVHSGSSACNITVPKGAVVTLGAQKNGGQFLYWADENMNTQCEEDTFSFRMVCPMYLQAWFEEREGTRIVYRNSNTTEQILASATYINSEYFTEHLVSDAVRFGYEFTGWSLSVEEIKNKIREGDSLVQVFPEYKKSILTERIAVEGGKIKQTGAAAGDFALGKSITLTADAPKNGERFVCWRDSQGTVVSFQSEFTTAVMMGETYSAMFAVEAPEGISKGNVGISVVKEDEGFRLWSKRCISDEYELLFYGFIYANRYGCDEALMTLDVAENNGMTVAEYSVGDNSGALTCVSYSRNISARAFAVYTDGVRFYTEYSETATERY